MIPKIEQLNFPSIGALCWLHY